MSTSSSDLVVFDRETSTWQRHPWQEVHSLAENVATAILDGGRGGAVGFVGEPTVELVAAIHGAWLAGMAVSILPGPVRGADVSQWAETTLTRFARVGVRTVFSNGQQLASLLDAQHPELRVEDLAVARRTRAPAHFTPMESQSARGIARNGRIHRRPAHRGVESGRGSRQCPWADRARAGGLLARRRAVLVAAVPRYGIDVPPCRGLDGGTVVAGADFGVRGVAVPLADWLTDSGATMTAAPNFAYNLIGKYARRVADIDLGDLRFAINGGEPIDCDGFARFRPRRWRLRVRPGRRGALLRTGRINLRRNRSRCPGAGCTIDDVPPTRESRSVGTRYSASHSRNEVRASPANERAGGVVGREVGEIEIRGSSMMSGYLGRASRSTPKGGFPTGDLGYFTDGGLVVCGRAKEVISVAGRNVFPAEIERVAAQVQGVREGAVVAVGTSEGAVRPGLVIAAEFRGADESGARSEVVRRVASECGVVPSDVVFLAPGSLPRTSSGKLRRLEVKRNLEARGPVTAVPAPSSRTTVRCLTRSSTSR